MSATFEDDDWRYFTGLIGFAERCRMLLAEAGYPDADVYIEPDGVHIDGVSDAVRSQAFNLADTTESHGNGE